MATYSGIVTVTGAGTAVQGTAIGAGTFLIKFLPTMTGYGFVGNNGAGSVGSASGYWLSPGDQIMTSLGNFSEFWFDTTVDGEKFSWLLVGSQHNKVEIP